MSAETVRADDLRVAWEAIKADMSREGFVPWAGGMIAALDATQALLESERGRVAEAETLLREWLSYTGLRSRAFDPDLDPDDDEYASGRALVTRTDAVLAGSVPDRNAT